MSNLLENILIPLLVTLFPIFLVNEESLDFKKISIWGVIAFIISWGLISVLKFKVQWIALVITVILSSLFNLGINYKYIDKRMILKSLIVIGLFFFSSLFQLLPIMILDLDVNNLTSTQETWLTLFSNLIVVIILFFLYRKEIIEHFKDFRKNAYAILDTAFKYWFIGLIAMVVSNLLINLLLPSAVAGNEEQVQEIIHGAPMLSLVCVGVLAPIIEEFTFRKAFRDIFSKPWLFVLVSGLVFGGLHVVLSLQGWQDLFYLLPYCSLGFAFGMILVKTNNIFASISVHMFHNICLTILSIIGTAMVMLW